MIYILLAAFAAGLSIGAGGVHEYMAGQAARHEREQAAAQTQIELQAKKIADDAAAKLVDMDAAYAAGESKAKTITKTVYVKGQAYAASVPAFNNPACVVPADGMLVLNRQRANLLTPTDTVFPDASVPAAGAGAGDAGGNVAAGTVPADAPRPNPVGGVRPKPQPVNRGGQVPR